MKRERQAYRLPGVASSGCFRKMYDEIDSSTIALEWMDTTLAEVKYQPSMRIYPLIVTFMRAALTSCVVLEGYRSVNTDFKPANILLSGIETGYITAKVGDLGLVVPSGSLCNAQPYAMRAPEVFLGQACAEPSQVWAVAAMLLCWINPGVLGVWNSPHPFINDAWCMAKIKRLFPHWKIPHSDSVEGHSLKAAVDAAKSFSKEVSELQAISPLCEEILQRPSASSVLASEEFKALEELART
ncbi:hypothetical protein BO79DRAFT_158633 [Aspergillus costaricaensis CBS 115574]|uniref:Uncharacterized protein n=1 Tax=Aspergillus costaricaensis CBS 115574 TaxID=1448317 RepID=A0ACD1I3L4_9EURO|nr:hypothetical protein BO79DRAFT_158633 [Aspergillus costaricaensis CBS 115574]RAK84363.1 hypothetical protein BO79DRAFT_158633 [Aspergillus costaricaensis CBS 115574]